LPEAVVKFSLLATALMVLYKCVNHFMKIHFLGCWVAVAYITKLKNKNKNGKKELTLRVCHKHNNGLMLPMTSSKFKSARIFQKRKYSMKFYP
jgi:hypothetical protein